MISRRILLLLGAVLSGTAGAQQQDLARDHDKLRENSVVPV